MNEPVKFEPFFTEADYPKFVARVDKRIEQRMEHLTVEKATVSYMEFIAECERRREVPNYQLVHVLAFRVWGINNGFHASDP